METELEYTKSKKMKGGSVMKKQKEKVGSMNTKLTMLKQFKERLDIIGVSLDFIEGS